MSRVVDGVRFLGHKPWFAAAARKLVWFDRWARQLTGGRFSPVGDIVLPTLLIVTTGAVTGRPRSQPLAYLRDGDDYIVVGSNWGQEHHPAWSGNLLAHPDARVVLDGTSVDVRAELVTGEPRRTLWARLEEVWPAFRTYEKRAAGREIRLFRLVPR
jgi:deazaflavin-dependent oxidoreductase (nitroreductase family)